MNKPHNERTEVERPFIQQLEMMGWQILDAAAEVKAVDPLVTKRESFRQVLLHTRMRAALRRVNMNDRGEEWLDDERTSQAVAAFERRGPQKLMESNEATTNMLLTGTVVDALPGRDGGRGQKIHYIDWENRPGRNEFLAVTQFRVDEPFGQAHRFIVPDIVLFINGIPLAVVECKSPIITEPVTEAITQLLRYSNQRTWLNIPEGNEKLFHANQFLIATDFDEARTCTICGQFEHYLEWKDTSPFLTADVATELGRKKLSSQQLLVAGMLRPELLLDITRHCVLYEEETGRERKIVSRYHQYRALNLAIHRLQTGATRLQDGEYDRRGGIVWHTQGSGKSKTMVFIVRKMRSIPALRKFKILIVTDRKDLQTQLSDTLVLTGETVKVIRKSRDLRPLLTKEGPAVIFAMVQKYNDRVQNMGMADDEGAGTELFPVLNESEDILIMIDEAHRSHTHTFHANLCRALPNAVKIGFTGTPIIMGAKKKTSEIFGEYIDTYTLEQAEADGVIVPIVYEGRTAEGAVREAASLDELFEDMFHEFTDQQREAIKQKYATTGDVMEAPKLIEAKAKDMLRHYIDNILPNGFKAQVVAHSRLAAVRYQEAFVKVRKELVEQVESMPPEYRGLPEDKIAALPRETQTLARAYPFLDELRTLEFAAVISGDHNDNPGWAEWTDPFKTDDRIERFKKPLRHDDPSKRDPLAFLIVKNMLLTGFDAPVEQVLYLDRMMKEHELLQAIARVNRTSPEKNTGIVVDYFGVARHLKEALDAYSAEDANAITRTFRSLKEEIPKLGDRRERVLQVFTSNGITDINDTLACLDLLEDEKIRADFILKLRQFLTTLDVVLPRPEALDYIGDAKVLGFIYYRARNRFKITDLQIVGVGNKVRKLIDDYVISNGVNPKVPPISIYDADFDKCISDQASDRAKASEMEHALRYHIRKHFDEDPARYRKLSEKIDEILQALKNNWADIVTTLRDIVRDVRADLEDQNSQISGIYGPFYRLLLEQLGDPNQMPEERLNDLAELTADIVDHIRQEVSRVAFWQNTHAQEVLQKWIVQRLDDPVFIEDLDRLESIADKVVEVAKANHGRLVS